MHVRGKTNLPAKNNHQLDALAITPVSVECHSLWLTELWALRGWLLTSWCHCNHNPVFCPLAPWGLTDGFPWVLSSACSASSCLCLGISIKSPFAFLCLFPCLRSGVINIYFRWKGVTKRFKSPVFTTQFDILREGKQEGLIAASFIYLPSLK